MSFLQCSPAHQFSLWKMLSRTFSGLRSLIIQKDLYIRTVINNCQQLSFKPTVEIPQSRLIEEKKKRKTQPVPKITLISTDDSITVTTLDDAQQLSKRRDLKLVKIVDLDTKTQRAIYKLMSGAEYHAEELKQREERKKQKQTGGALKGDKLLMLNSKISQHDLETSARKIQKWLDKKYEVRVVVSGDSGKSEHVYRFLESALSESTRFLQKRTKGNDLKFQIIPPNDSRGDASNPL